MSDGNVQRYELRFPRMAKYHRTCERAWADAVPAAALQALARAAVGRDRPHKDVDDAVAALWGKPVSPGVRSSPRKRAREAAWLERLERADGCAPKRARAQLVREDPQGNENVPVPAAPAVPERRRPLRPSALRPMASSTNLAGALSALTMVAPLGSASPAIPPRISARDIPPTPEPSCITQSRGSVVCDPVEIPHTVKPSRKPFDALPTVSVLPPLAPPTLITPPPSDDDRVPSPGAPSPSSSPLAAYLSTAMVWLARPCQSARPSSRVSLRALVPRQRVLHSLDALLIACGWRGAPPSGAHAVARGVVFVNVGADDAWAAHALRTLETELAKLAAAGGCPTAKPIVVLDADLLSHARLHEEHDFERDCVFLAEPRL
jgi:DNA ligase-4